MRSTVAGASALLGPLAIVFVLAGGLVTARGQDRAEPTSREAVPGDAPRATVAGLRSRIAELAERAERAGATALLDHARRALAEADRRRAIGDEAGTARAEAIASAAVRVAERQVDAARARTERDAARARLAEAEARAEAARQALERARIERARLEEAQQAPASSAEGAAGEEEE